MRKLTQDQKKKLKQDYKRKIKQEQKEILSEIIKKYHLSEIDVSTNSISEEHKLRLLDALSDEFCETGLQEDWEPNRRGLLIESLIDAVLDHKK